MADIVEMRNDALNDCLDYAKKRCIELEIIWRKMFERDCDFPQVVLDRYSLVKEHVKNLFDGMLAEEQESYEECIGTIKALFSEFDTLKKELSITDRIVDFDENVTENLYSCQMQLESNIEKYRDMKEERMSILEKRKQEETDLCESMGIVCRYGSYADCPSDKKLEEITHYLTNLKKEKVKRQQAAKEITNDIKELIKLLEISEMSDRQYAALSEDKFSLADDYFEFLKEWKMNLINEQENQTEQVIKMKERISLLYDRLEVDSSEREQFVLKTNKTCGKTVIIELKRELERCEELQKENLAMVIGHLREDLDDLWEKCHVVEGVRASFPEYHVEQYDEELLELHVLEVEKWRQYYAKTRETFDAAEKWFKLWNKMLELENKSNNIDRLNNRGGQLLKEERERKKIQKELPKVETKIQKLVSEYEKEHGGETILYNGRPIMAIVNDYWEERRYQKENEKENRKHGNISKRNPVTPLKSALKRPGGLTPSTVGCGMTTRKRGRPETSANKVIPRSNSASRPPLVPTCSKQGRLRRSKSQADIRFGSNLNVASTNSSLVSYNGFQTYIEDRSRGDSKNDGMPLRSSISTRSASRGLGSQTKGAAKTPRYAPQQTYSTPTAKRPRNVTCGSATKIPRLLIN